MIMGLLQDLTAFLLLAHMVTLSRCNIEGKGAFEEILARNVSIVVIEDKADDKPVRLEKINNSTSSTSGFNNSTVASNTTKFVDEKELLVKLEEALMSAASSGQVIMIAPPADRINSTNSPAESVILIETPINKSKSLIKKVDSQKNKKRKAIISNLDQEIAQSQRKHRADSQDYEDDEDLETLEDILSIAEYEPQRIDAKSIDEKFPRVTSEKLNSSLQSTNRSRPEDTHYDVPKQRNSPRNYQRITDDFRSTPLKKDLNEASSVEPSPRAVTSDLHPIQTNQKTTTFDPPEYKVERTKPTTPPTFDQKSAPFYTEISGESKKSGIIVPLTSKPSAPRKFTYSEIKRRNNLLGIPSTIDTTSTLLPDFSGSITTHSRNIQNLTNISNPSKKNLRSTRVQPTSFSLPSTYYPFLQHRASSVNGKSSNQRIQPTSAVPRISRRIDDHSNIDYVTSINEKPEPLANQQLGYLTRYNKPSLITRRFPNARVYPVASNDKEIDKSQREKSNDEEKINENISPKSSRITAQDFNEKVKQRSNNPRTTNPSDFNNYQTDNQRIQPIINYRNDGRSSIVKTTPTYESYEDDEDKSAVSQSEEISKLEINRPRVNDEIYFRKKNSPVAPVTTPVYDSYENEESEEPDVPQHQRFLSTGQQQQKVTTNPYVITNKQIYQPYNLFGKTLQSVIPTSLVDNPIYQLHGVKNKPGPIAANAIYNSLKNNEEKRLATSGDSLEKQTNRYLPRGIDSNQRIVSTTVASDSYEDSEESKSPSLTTQRLRNPNHVERDNDKALYNVDNINENKGEITSSAPTRKQNRNYNYDESINNQYSLYQKRPVDQLLPFAPERNSNFVPARVTTPVHVKNSDEDESNDERSYVPVATKLKALNDAKNFERKIPVIRSTAAPRYESYEEDDEEVNVTPSVNAKFIELNNSNYGSRVKPRVIGQSEPDYSWNDETNNGGRRHASVHVEKEPAESVYRAEVEVTPYEDVVPANSGHAEDQATHQTHEKAKKHGGDGGKGGDHKHEEGGGIKHDEDHHESHDEKGNKGYKSYHEYDKGKKGHHDKEGHDKEYDEKKGEEKKHEDEGSYHKEHHHGEKGDKEAEFAEKGEHQKGHSTKGQHVVHKKDEYEKKTEFYDESHEEDGDEKGGEYHHEHEHKKGGHEKKGHHDSAHHDDKYGEKGEHEKGHHYHEKKGHDGKDGKDQHHHHHEKYGKKGGHEKGLKWSFEKGDDGHEGGKKKGS